MATNKKSLGVFTVAIIFTVLFAAGTMFAVNSLITNTNLNETQNNLQTIRSEQGQKTLVFLENIAYCLETARYKDLLDCMPDDTMLIVKMPTCKIRGSKASRQKIIQDLKLYEFNHPLRWPNFIKLLRQNIRDTAISMEIDESRISVEGQGTKLSSVDNKTIHKWQIEIRLSDFKLTKLVIYSGE